MATNQVGVLVGLEIRQADDNVLGVETGGDPAHALGQFVDEILALVIRVGRGLEVDVVDDLLDFVILLGLLAQLFVVVQGHRVDADVRVDDEFLARQADPLVGQLGLDKGLFRQADVHHDLGAGGRDVVQVEFLDDEVELAVVDVAGLALGAAHRDHLTVTDLLGAVLGADDAGDAQLAADDRRVAGPAATVGDDAAGGLHDRLPVRVGHVGNQYFARPEIMDLADRAQDAGDALTDLGADRLSLGEQGALLLEHVGFHHLFAGLGVHRLRPGLDDEQPARADLDTVAVLGPFDVHGPAVVVLDDAGPARQLQDLVIAEDVGAALLRGGGHVFHRLRSARVGVVDHLDFLGAGPLADDRPLAFFEGRLENVVLVRVDRALDHVFAEPPGAGEEDRVLEARLGVDGEHDA